MIWHIRRKVSIKINIFIEKIYVYTYIHCTPKFQEIKKKTLEHSSFRRKCLLKVSKNDKNNVSTETKILFLQILSKYPFKINDKLLKEKQVTT